MKIKRFSYILNTATLHTFHFKKQNTQKKAIHTQVPSVEKCEQKCLKLPSYEFFVRVMSSVGSY